MSQTPTRTMAEEVIAMALEKEAKKIALGIPLTGKRHFFLNLKSMLEIPMIEGYFI
jgi:hypothetical protein